MDTQPKRVKEEPLVSVIINCFNGYEFLKKALDSVLSQSYQNWEIVFWDNQSDDKSKEIFFEYNDERLNYFYAPKHTRLYEARNYALKKAKGEFIAFLDVDDWWEDTKLECQLKMFEDDDVALVYSNFWFANKSSDNARLAYKKKLPSGYILDELLKKYPLGMLTIMVRKKSLDTLDYAFDSRYQMIGDFDLAVRLSINSKFACAQEPLAYYRLHENNMSKKHRKLQNQEIGQWLNEASANHHIANSKGFLYRKKLLLYYKGLEAIQNYNLHKAFKFFVMIPYNLKFKLFMYLITPNQILKIIGRG